ncbi:MAG: DMT family transporter [Spirochaetes bacterium]|nr:DMT family transporter [Spirochaetota bacterium]
MKNNNENLKGILALWFTVFLWGIHGPSARFLTQNNISLIAVAETRFLIGTFVFLFYLLIKKSFLPLLKNFSIDIIILSIVGLFFNSIFYHLGLKYIPATLVMILENLTPFFVIFFNLIFDKIKPDKYIIISLTISFTGLFLIGIGKGGLNLNDNSFYIGLIYEIIAGITFGFYTYYSGKTLNKLKNYYKNYNNINNQNIINQNKIQSIIFKYSEFNIIINLLFYVFIISTLAGFPFILDFKNNKITTIDLIVILQMGLFESGLAYILWNYGISKAGSSKASILFLMTVVFTLINEIIFLKFIPSIILIIGGFLIMAGSLYITINKNKPNEIVNNLIRNNKNIT